MQLQLTTSLAIGFLLIGSVRQDAQTTKERIHALADQAGDAVEAGEYSNAILLYREALEVQPRTGWLYMWMAMAYRQSGRLFESYEAYDHGILYAVSPMYVNWRTEPQDHARSDIESLTERLAEELDVSQAAELLATRGRCWLVLEDWAAAGADAQAAIDRDSSSPHGHLLKALLALRVEDGGSAGEPLARAEELCESDPILLETIRTIRTEHDRDAWTLHRSRLALRKAYAGASDEHERARIEEQWAELTRAEEAAVQAAVEEEAAAAVAAAEIAAAAAAAEIAAEAAAEAEARAAADVRELLAEQAAEADLEQEDRLYQEAAAAFEQADYPTAITRAETALAARPGHPPIVLLLARSLHLAGDDERAIVALEEIPPDQQSPKSKRLRIACAKAAFREFLDSTGGSQDRSHVTQPAVEVDEIVVRDLMSEGQGYNLDGDTEEALRCYREAARLMPDLPSPHERISRMLLATNRHDESLLACDDWRLRLEAAQDVIDPAEERLADIIRDRYLHFAEVDSRVSEHPEDADAWYEYGLRHLFRSDLTMSSEVAENLIAVEPERARGHALRADVLDRAGAPTWLVLEACERALALDEHHEHARSVARRVHARLGNNDWVLKDLTRAIEHDPSDPDYRRLLTERADLYVSRGDYGVAIEDYTRSLERTETPGYRAIHGRREAWLRAGDYASVLSETATSLEQQPDDRATMRERLRAQRMSGDEDGAEELAAQVEQSEIEDGASPTEARIRRLYGKAVAADVPGDDFGRALSGYTEILGLDSEHAGARLRRAVWYLTRGYEWEATEDISLEHDASYDDPRVQEILQRVQLQGYMPNDEELQYFGSKIKPQEDSFEAKDRTKNEAARDIAQALLSSSMAEAAASLLTEYLAESPDDVDLLAMRARIVIANMQGPAAAGLARVDAARCIELRPDEASHHMLMATILVSSGDADGALREFGRAVELAPDQEPSAREEMGQMLAESARRLAASGDVDGAVQEFNWAMELVPEEETGSHRHEIATTLTAVAKGLAAAGDIDGAFRVVSGGREIAPFHMDSFSVFLSVTFGESGDTAATIRAFGRAIELQPDKEFFHRTYLAQLLMRAGESEHALREFRRGFELTRELGLAGEEPWHRKVMISSIVEASGGPYRAIEELGRVAELVPDLEAWIRAEMARLHRKVGDEERSLREFNRAVELAGADPDLLVERGYVLRSNGRLDEALQDGIRAAELGSQEGYRLQAWIHNGRGEFDEALRCVDELLQKFPGAGIPDVRESYAYRELEFARLEAERVAYLERQAAWQAFQEETRAREAAEAEAALRRSEKGSFLERLNEALADVDASRFQDTAFDRMVEQNWNAGAHLQQNLNKQAQLNARCHELERRFGSSSAERERSIWRQ